MKNNIKSINEIDQSTTEGRLLLMALSVITSSSGWTDKTPDQALSHCIKLADEVYKVGKKTRS